MSMIPCPKCGGFNGVIGTAVYSCACPAPGPFATPVTPSTGRPPVVTPAPLSEEPAYRPCAQAPCYMLCGRLCARPRGHVTGVHRCADHGGQDDIAPLSRTPPPTPEPAPGDDEALIRKMWCAFLKGTPTLGDPLLPMRDVLAVVREHDGRRGKP